MSTTQPIRSIAHVQDLTKYYLKLGQHRNHRLIVFCLNTALRIGDLLTLRWEDVYDFKRNCAYKTTTIKEQKTGKYKTFAINDTISGVLKKAAKAAFPHEFLFSGTSTSKAISRIQAYRIITVAGEAIGLPNRISCHSLRKTFGYHAWKNGVSPAVIMEIYNHTNLSHTRRYLGITQDDLNDVYDRLGKAYLGN